MGKIYQCVGRYAGTPFIVKNTYIRLYSIEELCFYICHNAELIDEDFATKELIEWITDECCLPELANKLKLVLKQSIRSEAFAEVILSYCHYADENEIKETARVIKAGHSFDITKREEIRADYFIKSGRYALAFKTCEQLLGDPPNTENVNLMTKVHFNLGVIYAKLFFFKEAAEQFKIAYDMSGDREAQFSYLAAMRLSLGEMEYLKFAGSLSDEYMEAGRVEKTMASIETNEVRSASADPRREEYLKDEFRSFMTE